jgi:hypothetical protein
MKQIKSICNEKIEKVETSTDHAILVIVLRKRTASDEIVCIRRELEREIDRHLGGTVARRKRGQVVAIVSLYKLDAI